MFSIIAKLESAYSMCPSISSPISRPSLPVLRIRLSLGPVDTFNTGVSFRGIQNWNWATRVLQRSGVS
jgi:hypothetical protein